MSLPILVTPAAKPLLPKPSAPATPSDKPAFSEAYGAAERRTESSKPTAVEPEAKATNEAPAEATAEAKQPAADEGQQTPSEAQAPIDLQMMVAVASQIAVPVIQAVVQPAQPVAAIAQVAPAAEAVAAAPAPVPAAQEAVAEQVKPSDVAAKPQVVTAPQGEVASLPADDPAIAAPVAQPETGEQQQETSDEQNPQADKGPKPPVMPVATQQVAQSLESLRAGQKVSPLVNAAPEASVAKSPVTDAGKPVQEAAAAALVAEASQDDQAAQPVAEPVRPWQLPHAVGAGEVQAPQAQVLDDGAPAGEAMPMREAMRMPFTQAAKEPGKASELRLQLSPEHLGRMEIRVMAHEGTLSAQIRVDHAQARDMMQTQLAELRQSLADQGIKIDRLEVSVGQDKPRDQSFAFGGNLQQQAGQQQQQAHQPAAGRVGYYGTETFDEASEEAEALLATGVETTAVDYQA